MARLQRGQKAIQAPIEIGELRPLSRADLAVLAQPRPAKSIKTLRDNHHRIARAIASGMTNIQVAEFCGIGYNRVSLLKQDPAVIELIAHYRSILTAEWVATADPVIEYMRSNALKAQAMLSDKLDDAASRDEFLPTRDLLGIAELGLDRTGYGKERKNTNVNVDFAADMEKMLNRARVVDSVRVIEAHPAPQSGQAANVLPGASAPVPPSSPATRVARRF